MFDFENKREFVHKLLANDTIYLNSKNFNLQSSSLMDSDDFVIDKNEDMICEVSFYELAAGGSRLDCNCSRKKK